MFAYACRTTQSASTQTRFRPNLTNEQTTLSSPHLRAKVETMCGLGDACPIVILYLNHGHNEQDSRDFASLSPVASYPAFLLLPLAFFVPLMMLSSSSSFFGVNFEPLWAWVLVNLLRLQRTETTVRTVVFWQTIKSTTVLRKDVQKNNPNFSHVS